MHKRILKLITVVLLVSCCFSFVLAAKAETSGTVSTDRYSTTSAAVSYESCQSDIPSVSDESPSVSGTITWKNEKTGYNVLLEDDADLLSEEEKAQLALEMQSITAYGNAAFKSVSCNDYSASYFAREFYHTQFGQASGALFLIDMDNREIYIFSDGAVYRTITAAYANTITDNVYRYASGGDYYGCASKAFAQVQSLLTGGRIAQPMKYISNALLALILASLINYFAAMLLSGSAKPSSGEILKSISTKFIFSNPQKHLIKQEKTYSPRSSDSGGGHSSGSHSGGGHSSSHSSGGGGGHRF